MNATLRGATASLAVPAQALGSVLTPGRRRALRHGLILGGVVGAVIVGWVSYQGPAVDAYAYWVNRPPVSYGATPGTDGAYLYSPAFAQLISPLTALPWQLFLAIWLVAMLVTVAWLAGPLLLFPAVLLLGIEIHYGNIHFFMAAALVLGFRFPWTWALILLTKITPGVGLLWFVRRREWRAFAIACGATAAITVVSFFLDPQGWMGWLALLAQSAGAPAQALSGLTPLWLRLPLAAALVWWGAGKDARWTVPIAATIALPVIWPGSLALLVGIFPLLSRTSLRPRWSEALA